MSVTALLEDTYGVLEVDSAGKKFDKVSRLHCRGENYEMELLLDVHSELLRLRAGDKFFMALVKSLSSEGSASKSGEGMNEYDYSLEEKHPYLDKFSYVMHGTVFSIEKDKGQTIGEVLVSFGGLLMSLKGDMKSLQSFETDRKIYLLIRPTHTA